MARSAALTLERLLTSPDGFGLTTASSVQRAACRVLDGRGLGDLWKLRSVQDSLGDRRPAAGVQPKEFCLMAAIRSGKSLIAAAGAVRAALTCDVSGLRHGEMPRVSVVSLSRDLGQVTFRHIAGSVEASPVLAPLIARPAQSESIVLQHPSGTPVEIAVVAGARAGASLVARWSAGVIFDEAPRMLGSDDAVVNLDDARDAVRGRLLPGAQIVYIGSPWAPFGPIYEMVTENFGKPTAGLVVMRATGPRMNPEYWTPERVEDLRVHAPRAYRTDVLGEFVDPEENLLPSALVRECTRTEPAEVEPSRAQFYVAAMDPATRGNAWTLVVLTCTGVGGVAGTDPLYQVALARQWIGSSAAPLKPREVLAEIAEICQRYAVDVVASDQWAHDALRDLAEDQGVVITEDRMTNADKWDAFRALQQTMVDRRIELPPVPQLARDLIQVRKRTTLDGVKVVLPRTSDGRHCDYAPSLAMALRYPPDAPLLAAKRETIFERKRRELESLSKLPPDERIIARRGV